MIKLTVGHADKISIIWAFLLLLLWAVLVVDPDIDVDVPVDLFLVQKLDFKSCVSKPLEINLSLELLESQWSGSHFFLHLLGSLQLSHLLWSKVLTSWSLWWASSATSWWTLGLVIVTGAVKLGCEIVKFVTHVFFL